MNCSAVCYGGAMCCCMAGVGAVGLTLQCAMLSQKGCLSSCDQTLPRGICSLLEGQFLDQWAGRHAFCNIKQSKGSHLSFMFQWFSPDWFRAGEKWVCGMQSSTGWGAVGETMLGGFWWESAWLMGTLLLEQMETCSQIQYISHFC